MLIKFKYILFIFFSVQIVDSQVFNENALMNYKKSSYYSTNYNGPVKSSYWYYIYLQDTISLAHSKDSILQAKAKDAVMRHNVEIFGTMYRKFDERGRLMEGVSNNVNKSYFGKSELNYNTASIYSDYEEEDWIEKNNLKIKNKQIYPVYDRILSAKLNHCFQFYNSENITLKKYVYNVDKNNRIEESLKLYDSLVYEKIKYVYDSKENLIRLNIKTKQKLYEIFYFLGTGVTFCSDVNISYKYDEFDRITQTTFFGCNDTIASEKYTYHKELGYVSERIHFINTISRSTSHVTPTVIFYHNQNGDIIEKKYVRNYPNRYLGISYLALPESIYYEYEYDEHNNWVKCCIYMEGKPEDSEPTAIAQRDLEYYDS